MAFWDELDRTKTAVHGVLSEAIKSYIVSIEVVAYTLSCHSVFIPFTLAGSGV